jgi:hypothetical protein
MKKILILLFLLMPVGARAANTDHIACNDLSFDTLFSE